MSPLMIKMLLHYYACARDYRDEVEPRHASSVAVSDAIENFKSWELLIPLMDDADWRALLREDRRSQYTISDRGRAMVDAYTAIKLPVIQWVQP